MWTKHEYVCINCDSLIEITSQSPENVYPDCLCGRGNLIKVNAYPGDKPSVSKVTRNKVVKINTNPYN